MRVVEMSSTDVEVRTCTLMLSVLTGENKRDVAARQSRGGYARGMTYLPRLRSLFAPLCASIVLACGSSTSAFDTEDQDTGTSDDTSTAGDGSGTDGSGKDGSGTDGSGTDGSGTDGSGTDGSGTDSAGSDTLKPPTDASSCPGTVCGGVCTDTKTDPLNCGGCGKVVCHNEACRDGKPVCAPGLSPCGGAGSSCLGCKNLRTDPLNCGACGTACSTAVTLCMPSAGGGGSSCQVAATGCPTGTGLTRCPASGSPASCVNTSRDITNCGGCGVNCAPGEYCADGACTKYVSAPGCTTCPCAACVAPTDQCCRYTDGTVCSSKCISG
jgi:hypothetical protein